MKDELQESIAKIIDKLFGLKLSVELSRPPLKLGDYTTNVAFQVAGQVKKSPSKCAELIADGLKADLGTRLKDVIVAGNGFINIFLSDEILLAMAFSASTDYQQTFKNKIVVVEYSDPNPFKVLHAGHLYTSIVGDAISNLLEKAGGEVHRVNFGGDVGLHVAKAIWSILFNATNGEIEKEQLALDYVLTLKDKSLLERSDWLSDRYVEGNTAYESDPSQKPNITKINQRIYEILESDDHNSPLAQIYWTCRQWSYDYFEEFYKSINSKFEKYYPESQVAPIGLAKAKELLEKGILTKSENAVVYKGEDEGLHTRVFITANGLPTYETKDLGLQLVKWDDYHFDKSIIITANDIIEYMKVVLSVVDKFEPRLAKSTDHLTHGMVKLQAGEKMSSRKGNIVRATDVINLTDTAAKKLSGKQNDSITLGAIKYAFLKQRAGGDIIFDPKDSVSIEGNSGPYLQYAYARANSLLAKVGNDSHKKVSEATLEPDERSLASKISEYPEVIDKAVSEYLPHQICTYLYELAQVFNSFYESNRIIGNDRQDIRSELVKSYATNLKSGLELLNIPVLDHI